jgi:ParB family transcriptional regulator, chromosome partitioning protein
VPAAEAAVPSAEGAGPAAEAAVPSAEGAGPAAEAAAPVGEAAEPAGEAAEPAGEAAAPAGEAAQPAAEAPAPGAGEAGPETSPEQGAAQAAPPPALPEPRPSGPVVLTSVPLEQLEGDTTFQIRPEGEISKLATDIARLGQLFPVDVRPSGLVSYQIICGFRRVAALRFLKRDRVQVRVHTQISDEDALLLALASAIHGAPVEREELAAVREELEAEGRLSAAARDMLEKALETESSLAPESVEEEVDADELSADVAQRLGAINQDLSLLADVFSSLDESRRAELLMQLRYSAELVAYLESLR